MDISLVKALLLLYGFLAHGHPDEWDVAYSAGVAVAWPGPTATFEARIDPVAIYYRPIPDRRCGYSAGAYVVVDPKYPQKGCQDALAHELGHIAQQRAWGLVVPLTYPLLPGIWEPPEPWRGTEGMYIPAGLNWPLVRLWVVR